MKKKKNPLHKNILQQVGYYSQKEILVKDKTEDEEVSTAKLTPFRVSLVSVKASANRSRDGDGKKPPISRKTPRVEGNYTNVGVKQFEFKTRL